MHDALKTVVAGVFALAVAAACYGGVKLGSAAPAAQATATGAEPRAAGAPAASAPPAAAAAAASVAVVPPAAPPAAPAFPDPVAGGLVGAARDRFTSSGMARCVVAESASARGSASASQVDRYCGCFMDRLADGLSPEDLMEVYNAVSAGSAPPPRISRLMSTSSRRCWATAMARP